VTEGTERENFNLGVIGLGGVSTAHLEAVKDFEWLTIRAVCDLNETRAKKVAGDYAAKSFSSYRDLLEFGNYDLVLVLTPASTHREIVEAVARARFPILCEKPIAVQLQDAEAMLSICEEMNVPFFYGSSYRFLPAIQEARELIQNGEIGDIVLMTEQLVGGAGKDGYQQLGAIHYPTGGPGGAGMGLVDHGIHLIDILPWITGLEVQSASGFGQISGKPPIAEHAILKMNNGAIATLTYHAGTYSPVLPSGGVFSGGQGWTVDGSLSDSGAWDDDPGTICIYGTRGAIRILHYANKLFIRNADGIKEVSLQGRPAFGHFGSQIEACASDLANGEQTVATIKDGIIALRTLLQIYQSELGSHYV